MRKPLLVIAIGVVLIAVLVVVGIVVHSDWSSFVPDIIVGVIGAGAIAALIAFITWQAQLRHDRDAEVSVAYKELIQAVTDLRGADLASPQGREGGDAIRRMNVRMVVLGELVDTKQPALPYWFEAERQLAIHHALKSAEAVAALEQDDELHGVDDVLDASAPLLRWTAEFTNNVRFWRSGKLTNAEMQRHAERIESGLREHDAWHEPFSWRQPA